MGGPVPGEDHQGDPEGHHDGPGDQHPAVDGNGRQRLAGAQVLHGRRQTLLAGPGTVCRSVSGEGGCVGHLVRLLERAGGRRRSVGEDIVGEAAEPEGETERQEDREQHEAPR